MKVEQIKGHPAGYADELGLNPKHIWLKEQVPGWCVLWNKDQIEFKSIWDWCDHNLSDYHFCTSSGAFISNRNDLTLFMMTWG